MKPTAKPKLESAVLKWGLYIFFSATILSSFSMARMSFQLTGATKIRKKQPTPKVLKMETWKNNKWSQGGSSELKPIQNQKEKKIKTTIFCIIKA